jgi:hypothetical protein
MCYNITTEMKERISKMNKEIVKRANKKEGEELQEYLKTMKRHGVVPVKKGKGSKYNRAKEKRSDWE